MSALHGGQVTNPNPNPNTFSALNLQTVSLAVASDKSSKIIGCHCKSVHIYISYFYSDLVCYINMKADNSFAKVNLVVFFVVWPHAGKAKKFILVSGGGDCP